MRKFCLLAMLLTMAAYGNQITVKTFPDGYRDDKNGWVFRDHMAILIFHTWSTEKVFTDTNVELEVKLPKNWQITGASVTRRKLQEDSWSRGEEKDGACVWKIKAGKIAFDSVYRRSNHPWRPQLPWTDSSLVLFLKPERELPEHFAVNWSVKGEKLTTVEGVMKLSTIPVPRLEKTPRHKYIWSGVGMMRNAWTRHDFQELLALFRNIGITGIKESGGHWLPDVISSRELRQQGFDLIACQNFDYAQRRSPEEMRKAGFDVQENDLKLTADGVRRHYVKNSGSKQIYCFTAMSEPDSPVRAFIIKFYKQYVERDFNYFFSDYEPSAYNDCYCVKCRKAFAAELKVSEDEIQALSPAELAYRYPWELYAFRCRAIAQIYGLLNQELRLPVGWNSNLVSPEKYLPTLKSYGMVLFCEDPRIFDPMVAFHSADTLGTGLSSVYALEAFMQKGEDGDFVIKKPVISRANSLHWVNWGYFCIYGRQDFALEKGFKGLGVDYRRQLHKLEIAQHFAVGASGVEVYESFNTDALGAAGIAEGIRYAADYEDMIKRENRVPAELVRLYDCTDTLSPYEQKSNEGYLSSYFARDTAKYGSIQRVAHQDIDTLMISIFNWDFYQAKKLRVEGPEKEYYLTLDIDGGKQYAGQTNLKQGISFELPAGSYAVLSLSGNPSKSPVVKLPRYSGGRELHTFKPEPKSDSMDIFYQRVYNPEMKTMQRLYPNAGFRLRDQ